MVSFRKTRVVGRIGVREVGDEFGAVGESHGVVPTQSDELLHGEAVTGEAATGEDFRDLGHWHGWSGSWLGTEAVEEKRPSRCLRKTRVEGAAEHGQKVAGCGGKDVGTGDDVWAGQFKGGLGADDKVEGVVGEGEADVGVAEEGEVDVGLAM
ncbi:hypothetical protein LR48_Vigan641s010800 [Vigna angularis]|uniref:Uncharacterized protein n=1 Tax=Phaseolus angularis TaxID=3914 RepID=A0A0L9TFC8_PHAAN|nr:uncharacterized protein HKW66_Vig0053110 [Vigna angularis]KOM29320.1 hypothetical protein LR48_Vigan641s010800 [Vigna angularis]